MKMITSLLPLLLTLGSLSVSGLREQPSEELAQEAVCVVLCEGNADPDCKNICNSQRRHIPVLRREAEAYVVYKCQHSNDTLILESDPGVFIVEFRNQSSDWIADGITIISAEHPYYHFNNPGTGRYQWRFTRASTEGISKPEVTDWATVRGPGVGSERIFDIRVKCISRPISDAGIDGNVTAQIVLSPPEDASCIYNVTCSGHQGAYTEFETISFSRWGLQEATFTNLPLGTNFTVTVHDVALADDEVATTTFSTPPSWPRFHDSVCVPREMEDIDTTATSVTNTNIYDVNVTWRTPDYIPDFFIINLTTDGAESNGSREYSHNRTGASINTIFKGIGISFKYTVTTRAWSYLGGGPETSNTVKIPREVPHESAPDLDATIVTALLACVSLISVIGLCAYLIMHRRRKRRQQKTEVAAAYTTRGSNGASNEMINSEITPDRLVTMQILGSGTFGDIILGRLCDDEGRFTDVLVKTLRDNSSETEQQDFRLETDMMRSLGRHPNVVSILAYHTVGHEPFLVFEYCPRGDLLTLLLSLTATPPTPAADDLKEEPYLPTPETRSRNTTLALRRTSRGSPAKQRVNRGKRKNAFETDRDATLTVLDVLNFGRQIAKGMEFLSSRSIVHPHLAARNILVCDDRALKISDFGLSRDTYQESMYRRTARGSQEPLRWMAIESLSNQVCTTPGNVWSFGVLLWEVCTLGGTPYPGVPTVELRKRLQKGYRMERPEKCSEALYNVMLTCWKAKPKHRPTFTVLRKELDKLIYFTADNEYIGVQDVLVDMPVGEEDSKTSRPRDTSIPVRVGFVNDNDPRIVH